MQSNVQYHHMLADNMEKYQSNSDIQDMSTKKRYDIHAPNTNLNTKGIGLFNKLPPTTVKFKSHYKRIYGSL
jgi:hypothetical protein